MIVTTIVFKCFSVHCYIFLIKFLSRLLTQRMCKGYSTHFCVSLTALEATLIYSAKKRHQWTANGILFIFIKLKSCEWTPSIHKQLSKLTALYHTSYGHARQWWGKDEWLDGGVV